MDKCYLYHCTFRASSNCGMNSKGHFLDFLDFELFLTKFCQGYAYVWEGTLENRSDHLHLLILLEKVVRTDNLRRTLKKYLDLGCGVCMDKVFLRVQRHSDLKYLLGYFQKEGQELKMYNLNISMNELSEYYDYYMKGEGKFDMTLHNESKDNKINSENTIVDKYIKYCNDNNIKYHSWKGFKLFLRTIKHNISYKVFSKIRRETLGDYMEVFDLVNLDNNFLMNNSDTLHMEISKLSS